MTERQRAAAMDQQLVKCKRFLPALLLCVLLFTGKTDGTLYVQPMNVLATAGQSVTLRCAVEPNTNADLVWLQSYQSFVSRSPSACSKAVSRPDVVTTGTTGLDSCNVTFTAITDNDAGPMSCQDAVNTFAAFSTIIILTQAPTCGPTPVTTTVTRGSNVTISCTFSYKVQSYVGQIYPPPTFVNTQWAIPGQSSLPTVPMLIPPGINVRQVTTSFQVTATGTQLPAYTCSAFFTFQDPNDPRAGFDYALNTVDASCTTQPLIVQYCPSTVAITPPLPANGEATAGTDFTCAADSVPASTFTWAITGSGTISTTSGSSTRLTSVTGPFTLTCTASAAVGSGAPCTNSTSISGTAPVTTAAPPTTPTPVAPTTAPSANAGTTPAAAGPTTVNPAAASQTQGAGVTPATGATQPSGVTQATGPSQVSGATAGPGSGTATPQGPGSVTGTPGPGQSLGPGAGTAVTSGPGAGTGTPAPGATNTPGTGTMGPGQTPSPPSDQGTGPTTSGGGGGGQTDGQGGNNGTTATNSCTMMYNNIWLLPILLPSILAFLLLTLLTLFCCCCVGLSDRRGYRSSEYSLQTPTEDHGRPWHSVAFYQAVYGRPPKAKHASSGVVEMIPPCNPCHSRAEPNGNFRSRFVTSSGDQCRQYASSDALMLTPGVYRDFSNSSHSLLAFRSCGNVHPLGQTPF